MKSNKQKFLDAAELLIKMYSPGGSRWVIRAFDRSDSDCPLCKITDRMKTADCTPCPLANKENFMGCLLFESYKDVMRRDGYKALTKRKEFWQKTIPILKNIPAKRFTKTGWKYFEELNRDW